jgi:tripartite-type tricarboxylate transporter receptor subunit TctC
MKRRISTLLAIGSIAFAASAGAQEWPAGGPIRLISPYAAGGTNDVSGRIVAEQLEKALGQRVIVENKTGANTQIGTDLVVKSAPDGYTLLWTAAPHTTNPALFPKLPYDTADDLTPIVKGVELPLLFSVPASSPAKTVAEYLELVAKRPDQGSICSPGSGSAPHLAIELFAAASGAKLQHIPYRGDAQAVVDLVGGVVGAGMNGFGTPLPHVQSGKVRPLAVVAKARMPQLPEVPTFVEAGFPSVDANAWFGLLGPAKLPPAIVSRLNAEVNRILKQPEVIERLAKIGAVPIGGSAEEFDTFIRNDIERWKRVVKERDIKLN